MVNVVTDQVDARCKHEYYATCIINNLCLICLITWLYVMPKYFVLNYPIYNVVADGYYIHVWPK